MKFFFLSQFKIYIYRSIISSNKKKILLFLLNFGKFVVWCNRIDSFFLPHKKKFIHPFIHSNNQFNLICNQSTKTRVQLEEKTERKKENSSHYFNQQSLWWFIHWKHIYITVVVLNEIFLLSTLVMFTSNYSTHIILI